MLLLETNSHQSSILMDLICYIVGNPFIFPVTFVALSAILLADMVKKNSDARARFAQRLRAIRIPRGYKTARSFANALDIDENRYTRYERAEVEPDLQLLMKICGLLGATPNDLLCDTIGMQPLDIEVPLGFAERAAGGGYQPARQASYTTVPPQRSVPDSLSEARRAVAWELATVVAMLEATAEGLDPDSLSQMERLRRIAALHARIDANPFAFLGDLPDRLNGIQVPSETEVEIENLIGQIVTASKPGANDNG